MRASQIHGLGPNQGSCLFLAMTNSWNEFVKPPGVAIQSGPCANVIADSTRWLQQCVQEQLSYLDKRARALATTAHFEAALKDATTMQQLNPSSAAGYLCAGHVCSHQGREKAAIAIYDQGLAVVPLSDPSYQQLVDARSRAQAQNCRCIDFIKELPVDIIENIVSRILTEEAMAPSEVREYLGVSREWQEKLLQCSRWLHVESTTSDDLAKDDELLEQVAPYCTGLTLGYHTAGLSQLMSETQYPSLRTLIARE
ncbi:hypothetical protein K492DRAFT_6952 [Lichtheimia hyalospora FSU 10163]|nr:hypothetical protein K492DRAFT_6952 [Lichtheimia hyalospora FSU 10163]